MIACVSRVSLRRGNNMNEPRVFKDYKEMIAFIRHKYVEVEHPAVKVEEVKPKKKATKKKKEDK